MLNVLLVDDEVLVRKFMRSLMDWESEGFQIRGEASHGEEALDMLMAEPIDIVITDIRMPVMDGLKLTERIRELKLPCKIIILTGYDDFQYTRKALQLQVQDYIHKPTVTSEELLATLTHIAQELKKSQSAEWVQRLMWDGAQDKRKKVITRLLSASADPSQQVDHLIPLLREQFSFPEGFRFALFSVTLPRDYRPEYASSALTVNLEMMEEQAELYFQQASPDTQTIVTRIDDRLAVISEKLPENPLTELQDKLRADYSAEVMGTVSPGYHRLEELPRVYKQCSDELERMIQEQQEHAHTHVLIVKALQFIHERYMEELTLERIGEHIHMSSAYFSRLFYKETGINFSEHLTKVRIEQAKRLLENSNLKIYEIAEKAGYQNSKYFLKLFRDYTGMTPGDYRESTKNRP
ncbi:hypothetical protein SY83_09985 [Paenibacillus swuensis]|uniref:AraC family transcriptional regulator n=1 Tax=Paenibacillus swuensis TaxID=1178515 RepID=A0A172THW2_9BACL|nr:response regulator [Paenibacillus swuensis]ANE46552.1 hypothetical protein SY83_09985 [Paenibacillus swuensis]